MKFNMDKYEDILFSFLYRDEEFPAVKKSKGFSVKGCTKVFLNSIFSEFREMFKDNKGISGKIWLYAESINQLKALEGIHETGKTILITRSHTLMSRNAHPELKYFNLPSKLFFRIKRLPLFAAYNHLFGRKFWSHLNTIIKYDAVYESLRISLTKDKPRAIIFSNDHNAFCRALLVVAKDLGIKTIYIQHAAVTNRFPPLKFDYNLLEGQDSVEKYQQAGPIQGEVLLVGMLKFDNYYPIINQRTTVSSVGIALNPQDDINLILQTFEIISAEFSDLNFWVRFHPSLLAKDYKVSSRFLVSNPQEENSFDFLSRIDLLFSGNSSIHLEATLMNVKSYQFSTKEEIDYYGFLKKGLIDRVELNINNISLKIIENRTIRSYVRDRAIPFVSTIGTRWDGRTRQRINIILSAIL